MSKLGFTKRILAGLISFAMVFQGMAAPVIAAESKTDETVLESVEDAVPIQEAGTETGDDIIEEDLDITVVPGYTSVTVKTGVLPESEDNDYYVAVIDKKTGSKIGENSYVSSNAERQMDALLIPGKEYTLEIRDESSTPILKLIDFTTKSFDASKLTVTASPSSENGKIDASFRYEFDECGYEEIPCYAELRDADGRLFEYDTYYINKSNGETSANKTVNFSNTVPADRNYKVTVGIGYASDPSVTKTSAEVTPTKDSSVDYSFEVTESEVNAGAFDVKIIKISGFGYDRSAKLYYTTESSKDLKIKSYGMTIDDTSAGTEYTGTAWITDGIEYGEKYTFWLVIDGQVKELSNVTFTNSKFSPSVTDEIGYYVHALDFSLNPIAEMATDTYSIRADYYKLGESYSCASASGDLDSEFKLTTGVKGLLDDQEYNICYTVRDSESHGAYSFWKKIKTQKYTKDLGVIDLSSITASSTSFSISIPTGISKEDFLSDSLYVKASFIDKNTGDEVYTTGSSLEYTNGYYKTSGYYGSGPVLSSDTDYIIRIISNDDKIIYAEKEFKTLKDTRQIIIDGTEELYKGVIIRGSVKSNSYSENLTFAYRKIGETEWKTHNFTTYYRGHSFAKTFNLSEYKSGDVIEYKVGITAASVDAMTVYTLGTCKIPEDIRVLQKISETQATDGAVIRFKEMGPKSNGSIYAYYKEAGTETWNRAYPYPDPDVDREYTVVIPASDSKKSYEYKIGYADETGDSSVEKLIKTITGKVSSGEDDRAIASVNVEPGLNYSGSSAYANITGEISGVAPTSGTCVRTFIKKKGSEDPEIDSFDWVSFGESEFSIYYGELALDTTYEYTVGIGENSSTAKDALKSVKKGEFKTPADTRTIKNVEVVPGYNYINVKADVSLIKEIEDNDLYILYKKKGEEIWNSASLSNCECYSNFVWKVDAIPDETFDLDTEYEYVITFDHSTPVADIPDAKKAAGTFKTKNLSSEGIKVIFTKNDVATTEYSASMDVEVTGTTDLKVDLAIVYVDPADKDNELTKNITITKQKNYKNTIVFDDGLKDNCTYNITKVIVTGYDLGYDMDHDYYYYAHPLAPAVTPEKDTSFTTKAYPANPTELTLSAKKLFLNSSYPTYPVEGVNYETLNATLKGDNVNRQVKFTSSDESVAYVYGASDRTGYFDDEDSARVLAAGPGKATISANSIADKSLTGSVEVVVKDCVIGYEDDLGFHNVSFTSHSGNKLNLYKGKSIKEWKLYENTGEGYKAVSANAIAEREDILEIKEGSTEFTAKNVGSTALYFVDKDGVKAAAYVNVSAEGRKFAISGLNVSGDSKYAAIEKAWVGNPAADKILDKAVPTEYDLALAGVTYNVKGEISPKNTFYPADFIYSSSDESVATINSYGVITPIKAGKAVITVKPNETLGAIYKADKFEFTVNVKALPNIVSKTIYVETHTAAKLKDVDLAKLIGEKDWEWEVPETPLYSLPVNSGSYSFGTMYTGSTYFPVKSSVNVYLSTINKINVKDYSLQLDKLNDEKNAKSVITADGKDAIYLSMEPSHYGNISGLAYDYDIPAVTGLTVVKDGNRYKVTSNAEGTYKLAVKATVDGKAVAEGEYTIQAVKDQLVGSIELGSADEIINAQLYEGMIYLDSNETKTFAISANAIGRDGKAIATALEWKTTDKAVVTVTPNTSDSHKAELKVVGNGHAVISVTAKDAAGFHKELKFQVRNHQPRMEDKNATVNTVFDYETSDGINYANANCQHIEVAGVYAEEVNESKSKIVKMDGSDSEFEIFELGINEYNPLGAILLDCIIKPKKENADVANGTYSYKLSLVTKYRKEPYEYPIKIKVVNTPVKAKVKSTAMNLFYLPDTGNLEVSLNYKGLYIPTESPVWVDNNGSTGNEFTVDYSYQTLDKSGKSVVNYSVGQRKVAVKDAKLADTGVDTGKLTIRIPGIRNKDASGVSDKITIENVKIATKYQKAKITAYNYYSGRTVTNFIPEIGYDSDRIEFYDKTLKSWLTTDSYCDDENRYYNGVYSGTPDIKVIPTFGAGYYTVMRYVGNKKSENATLTFVSDNWRETATAKHSIKCVAPKAALGAKTITINKKYYNSKSTYIYLKPNIVGFSNYSDMIVEGADARAKALIADDRLQVYGNSNSKNVYVKLNNLNVLKEDVPNGKYTFKITPCVKKTDGTVSKLNTLKLTVNVIDKDLTAKVTASGAIDLINQNSYYNAVKVKPKFTGAESMSFYSAKLVGEYSNYFKFYYSYGEYDYEKIIKNTANGLKAKQNYKMKIEYTFKSDDGKMFKVTSNEFTIKTKQSKPSIKVGKINRNFFVATENMNRMTTISVKGTKKNMYYYAHSSGDVLGSIDVNKDGKPDAQVVYTDYRDPYDPDDGMYVYARNGSWTCSADIDVQILDKDALLSSDKGTKHTIPITVKFVGRDGIAKDSTAKITINVKR